MSSRDWNGPKPIDLQRAWSIELIDIGKTLVFIAPRLWLCMDCKSGLFRWLVF